MGSEISLSFWVWPHCSTNCEPTVVVSYMCKWGVVQTWIPPASLPPAPRGSSLREQQGSSSCRARGLVGKCCSCSGVLPFCGVPHASLWHDEFRRGRTSPKWWCWPQKGLQVSDDRGLGLTSALQPQGLVLDCLTPAIRAVQGQVPDCDQDYRGMDTEVRKRHQLLSGICASGSSTLSSSLHRAAVRPTNAPVSVGHSGAA